MIRAMVALSCPNGHFEITLRARSANFIELLLCGTDAAHYCPGCNEPIEPRWFLLRDSGEGGDST